MEGWISVKTHMLRLVGLLALAIGLLVSLSSGPAVLAQTPVDCTGIETYVEGYHQVGVVYMSELQGLDTSDLEHWTQPEFEQARAAVEHAIAGIQALQPPAAAASLQQQAIASLQLFGEMLDAIQTDGVFAAIPYVDQISAASDELDAIAIPLEEQCQIAILDNDDDGVPEIGPGAPLSMELDPSAPLGDFANPYPVGAAQRTVDGWTIQVVSVEPDATQQVLAENSFNEEPEGGRQFVIATITATYTRPGSASFDGNFRLRLRGADNTVYTAFGDACGVTPNEWDEEIVVSMGQSVTGNLCWSVPTDELPAVRMFDKASQDAGVNAFWSLGQES